MTRSRRAFLTATTGVTIASAGCLRRLNPLTEDPDDDSDGESGETGTAAGDDANTTNNTRGRENETTRENGGGNGSAGENGENATNESNETAPAEEEKEEEEHQPLPDENDTTVDREQYNETKIRDVTDRPEDDVEIAGVSHYTMPNGVVTVSATITNVSEEDIDFVDIEIIYLNAADEMVGNRIGIVKPLPAGSTAELETSISPDELRGEVADVRIDTYPQDYVTS